MSEHKFKPFDRVLVRDANDDVWRCQFYSHRHGYLYVCLNGVHTQCIPFAGNEVLLGTTDWPEPEFKKGDAVLVWDEGDSIKMIKVYSHFDGELHKHVAFNVLFKDKVTTEGHMWDHAEKFVPASVETQGDGHTELG